MFSEKRVAQMAAYFLNRRGGTMSHLKLMKLLYLSDRESFMRYGHSISDDHLVSMPHGPVLSRTLELMSGDVESSYWGNLISGKENNELSLKSEIEDQKLDELSKADVEIISSLWEKFGEMSRWEIRDFTHEHCKEWEDPHGSVKPIPLKSLFDTFGWPESKVDAILKRNEEYSDIDKVFSSL